LEKILADEVALYRELFVLTDRQREWLESDSDIHLCQSFEDIERVQKQIEESESKLTSLKEAHPGDFVRWIRTPRVAPLFRDLADLVARTQQTVTDCEHLARRKRTEYRLELTRMGVGRLLFDSMVAGDCGPRFVDHRP
jgi:hypothetical protein